MVYAMHAMLINPTARTQKLQLDETEDTSSPQKQFSVAAY